LAPLESSSLTPVLPSFLYSVIEKEYMDREEGNWYSYVA
jgi:hypothetical protein